MLNLDFVKRLNERTTEVLKREEYNRRYYDRLFPIVQTVRAGHVPYINLSMNLADFLSVAHIAAAGNSKTYCWLHDEGYHVDIPMIHVTTDRYVYMFIGGNIGEGNRPEEHPFIGQPDKAHLWDITEWAEKKRVYGLTIVVSWRQLMNDNFVRVLLDKVIPEGDKLSTTDFRNSLA